MARIGFNAGRICGMFIASGGGEFTLDWVSATRVIRCSAVCAAVSWCVGVCAWGYCACRARHVLLQKPPPDRIEHPAFSALHEP